MIFVSRQITVIKIYNCQVLAQATLDFTIYLAQIHHLMLAQTTLNFFHGYLFQKWYFRSESTMGKFWISSTISQGHVSAVIRACVLISKNMAFHLGEFHLDLWFRADLFLLCLAFLRWPHNVECCKVRFLYLFFITKFAVGNCGLWASGLFQPCFPILKGWT